MEVMRSSFSQLPFLESFIWLCILSMAWLVAGTAVFSFFLQKSKKKGNLLLYKNKEILDEKDYSVVSYFQNSFNRTFCGCVCGNSGTDGQGKWV